MKRNSKKIGENSKNEKKEKNLKKKKKIKIIIIIKKKGFLLIRVCVIHQRRAFFMRTYMKTSLKKIDHSLSYG